MATTNRYRKKAFSECFESSLNSPEPQNEANGTEYISPHTQWDKICVNIPNETQPADTSHFWQWAEQKPIAYFQNFAISPPFPVFVLSLLSSLRVCWLLNQYNSLSGPRSFTIWPLSKPNKPDKKAERRWDERGRPKKKMGMNPFSFPLTSTGPVSPTTLLLFIYTHFFIYLMWFWEEGAITAVICGTNVQSRTPSLMWFRQCRNGSTAEDGGQGGGLWVGRGHLGWLLIGNLAVLFLPQILFVTMLSITCLSTLMALDRSWSKSHRLTYTPWQNEARALHRQRVRWDGGEGRYLSVHGAERRGGGDSSRAGTRGL